MATSNTDWKIIQKIDLTEFFSWNKQLRAAWSRVDSHCRAVTGLCARTQEIALQLDENEAGERNIASLIQGHAITNQSRRKRAVLPFVGRISRILFGTLDEDAMQQIEQAIEASTNESRKVASLLADQTEIISEHFNITDAKIADLEKVMLEIHTQNSLLESNQKVFIATSMLADFVSRHARDVEMLTDAILFASRGVIHPRLVPITALQNSAATAQRKLHHVEFPIDGISSISQLFGIVDLKVIFQKMHLIYYIAIPLLDKQKFTLFKTTPLPIRYGLPEPNNTFAYIWPATEYVAINSTKKLYVAISLNTMNKCKTMGQMLICKNSEPIRDAENNAPCEVQLIVNNSIKNVAACDIKMIRLPTTFWTRLHAPNTWAFSATNAEPLFIQCRKGESVLYKINNAGLLKLNAECSAHTADARLLASETLSVTSPVTVFFNYSLNILATISDLTQDNELPDLVQQALADGNISLPQKNNHNSQTPTLRSGTALHNIIEKARTLAQYRSMNSNLYHLNTASLTAGSIFVIITILLLLAAAGLFAYRRHKEHAETQRALGLALQALGRSLNEPSM